jgi:hypothetical protein
VSRLGSLSPAAIRALLSAESDDNLIALFTFTGAGIVTPLRIADNYTTRLSETDEDILYGVQSRGNDFVFLPLGLTLPDENDSAPRATLTIHDVTRYLTPVIRNLTGQPSVLLELVLVSSPDVVEASFPGMVLGGITYNKDTVSGELTIDGLATEPFPAHSFTPAYFPGLF